MLHFSNIRVRASVSARRRRSGAFYRLVALVGALAVLGLGAAPATAQTTWIARSGTQDVVRIDTTTNTVIPGSIPRAMILLGLILAGAAAVVIQRRGLTA